MTTDCPRDDFDPEIAAATERRRYDGKNFSVMYYPQGIEPFYPTAKNAALPIEFNAVEKCVKCKASSQPMRHIKGWPYWCVPCMKLHGFGGPKGEVFLPEEVIMQIMCFVPTFHDMSNLARVSRRYLNAYNYATSEESALTAVKRKLLGKEFYICGDFIESLKGKVEVSVIPGVMDVEAISREIAVETGIKCFVSGPPAMIKAYQEKLAAAGLPSEHIIIDAWE